MPTERKSWMGSTLAKLLKRRGAASEEARATDALLRARRVTDESHTFQGRPVVKIMWEGEEVEAVQGLVAYRVRQPNGAIARDEVERALDVPVLGSSAPDELGIGVIATDEHVASDRIASAADSMGPDVLWTEPVLLEYGALHPNDAFFSQQWALARLNAPRGWELWNGDPNRVVLAILDSGIPIQEGRLSHPDLLDAGRIFLGPDLVNHDPEPRDDHGHGTHIAGIATATMNNGRGVAGLWPGLVFIVKVFNDRNLEGSTLIFEQGVRAAVAFARQRGARLVINYSGGGPDAQLKRVGVQHASDNNALLVAAAGNNDGQRIINPASSSTQFSNVIAVGAVDRNNRRPPFANRGPQMTVVAPGVGILSTLPNYAVGPPPHGPVNEFGEAQGTSQATALVSALAALVWSKSPHLSAAQVRERIARTATPLSGSSNDFGSGLINAEAALS